MSKLEQAVTKIGRLVTGVALVAIGTVAPAVKLTPSDVGLSAPDPLCP